MKTLFLLSLVVLASSVFAQLKVVQPIVYYKDASFTISPLIPMATANSAAVPLKQMRDTISARIAGFKSGTVTAVGSGLGLSGGTITAAGILSLDTASASVLSRQRAVHEYTPKTSMVNYMLRADTLPLSNYITGTNGQLAKFRGDTAVIGITSGTEGQVMKIVSGSPVWATQNPGTVTLVGAGLGLYGAVTTSGTLSLDTANENVLTRQRAFHEYTSRTSMVNYALKADTLPLSNYINGLNGQVAKFRGDTALIGITAGSEGQYLKMVSGSPVWATSTAVLKGDSAGNAAGNYATRKVVTDLVAQDMDNTISGINLFAAEPVIAFPLMSFSVGGVTTSLTDGYCYRNAFYINEPKTITGVHYALSTSGDYTADNFNGFALYAVSGITATQVAISANDANFWKSSSGALGTAVFTTPYEAQPGAYYIVMIYNSSAQVTAPVIFSNTATAAIYSKLLVGGSKKLMSYLSGQTTLPSSFDITTGTHHSVIPAIWLY